MTNRSFIKFLRRDKLLLPPLSGYTDYPFRCILSLFHPNGICTEMVNARAVIEQNSKTLERIRREPGDHSKGAQLVGSNPSEMGEAARILQENGFEYIDINMGCTVRKVVSKGQGVALMKDEPLAEKIVAKICSLVSVPVTVKMRSGVSESAKNAVSLAKKLEQVGVSAITVHGRSGQMKFGKHVDYQIIKEVVDAVDLPVVANGGVDGDTYLDILKCTGAAAVMPGRSIIGNPWIIDRIRKSHTQMNYHPPPLSEKKDILRNHLNVQCQFYGEYTGVRRFRTILPKYFRFCQNLNELKAEVTKMNNSFDVLRLLERIQLCDGQSSFQ